MQIQPIRQLFIALSCSALKKGLLDFNFWLISKLFASSRYESHCVCIRLGKTFWGSICKCKKTYRVCQKLFGLDEDMRKHFKTKHGGEKSFMRPQKNSQSKTGNLFQCSVCYKKFDKKEKLKAHVKVVHVGKKIFQCSLCPAKFGSMEKKTNHLASNHAITGVFKETQNKNQSEYPEIKLIRATETRREYLLPYGWKKIGHKRSEIQPRERWDFYIFSPYGKMLRSTPEVKRYLDENPELECDIEVTNTSYPLDMNHLRRSLKVS